jgi:hypothetical protein
MAQASGEVGKGKAKGWFGREVVNKQKESSKR